MKDIVKVQEEMKGNFHVKAYAIMPLRKFYYDTEALKKSRSVKCQYLKCNYSYNILKIFQVFLHFKVLLRLIDLVCFLQVTQNILKELKALCSYSKDLPMKKIIFLQETVDK